MGKMKNILMQEHVTAVKALFNDTKYNFVAIGYHLRKVDDDRLYRETGHDDIWEFAAAQFGLSKSSTSRFMGINRRFSEGGYSEKLAEAYKEFSVSQLQEMVPLTDEQISMIDSTSTVREIRDMKPKKSAKPEQEGVAMSQQEVQTIGEAECKDCDLYRDPDFGETKKPIPAAGQEEMQERQMPLEDSSDFVSAGESVAVPQQENPAAEEIEIATGTVEEPETIEKTGYDPEQFNDMDIKYFMDKAMRNLLLAREENIISEIRKRLAIEVEAYRALLSKRNDNGTDEIGKLMQYAAQYYDNGDYDNADFYLFQSRKVLNEQHEISESPVKPEIREMVKYPALPDMKNNNMRGEFIDNFESWPLWIECEELGERIYRLDIEEGIAIAVREKLRHKWIPGKGKRSDTELEYAGHEYYLIGLGMSYGAKGYEFRKTGGETFMEAIANRSALIEFLKKYQKGEIQ